MAYEQQAQAAGQNEAAQALFSSQPAGSGRVILRPASSDDESEFLGLVHASAHLLSPWMSLPAAREDFQAYIRRYEQPGDESLLICLRSTGAIAEHGPLWRPDGAAWVWFRWPGG